MPAKTDYDQWKTEALAVKSDEAPTTSVPLHVLFGEAVDVAKFFGKYWEPVLDAKKNVTRRGLISAMGERSRIHAKMGDEILSLQRASQDAHTRYLLTVDPKDNSNPIGRGQFLIGELTATLEWYFDDGVQDDKDIQLAALNTAHADDPETADAIASALDEYAALADQHREAIDGLGGFEAAFIDEARAVAKTLRERPATPMVMSDASRAAIGMRNRMLSLLWDRMSTVRGAARFVFRNEPDIVREATSAHERAGRAARRRAQTRKAAEAAKKAEAEKAKGEAKAEAKKEGGEKKADA